MCDLLGPGSGGIGILGIGLLGEIKVNGSNWRSNNSARGVVYTAGNTAVRCESIASQQRCPVSGVGYPVQVL